MLTWEQINKKIKWRKTKSPYGSGTMWDKPMASEKINIPVFYASGTGGDSFWAPSFAFRLQREDKDPGIILYDIYNITTGKQTGGQFFGYGILGFSHFSQYKKAIQAYFNKDFETMKELIPNANRRKAIIDIFS